MTHPNGIANGVHHGNAEQNDAVVTGSGLDHAQGMPSIDGTLHDLCFTTSFCTNTTNQKDTRYCHRHKPLQQV